MSAARSPSVRLRGVSATRCPRRRCLFVILGSRGCRLPERTRMKIADRPAENARQVLVVTGDAFQYPDLRTRPIEHAKAESEGDSDPAIRAMYWSIIARVRGDDPSATRNGECSRAALPNI